MRSYEELVADALDAPFRGWDFGWLEGRTRQADPSWSYEMRARALIVDATALLDVCTGGGEMLASLAPLPERCVATESWEPNIPVARGRLAPLGVEVRVPEGDELPAEDGEFDLVVNRHGAASESEIARVLRAGGTYLEQGVGARNLADLNQALGAPDGAYAERALLDTTAKALRSAGLEIVDGQEETPEHAIHDIGALVYFLKAVSWQVPGFDVDRYDTQLRAIDATIRRDGRVVFHDHRYLVEARKP
ncbi:class I SAM-dependent methyltransferase [Pseudonocardia sp. TRM90224]|uniref:class I SAM-dependent methyltransferase n=1 Tax=Pseudonocardia sp. TRM90224 TaxID=2812678 RepID=UPI001E56BB18|nr:class I SAM-dependent methyltransferase [Pseudonocardia sp. TRM90224]